MNNPKDPADQDDAEVKKASAADAVEETGSETDSPEDDRAGDRHDDEHPEEQQAEERPAEEHPADDHPAEERPEEERPADEHPAEDHVEEHVHDDPHEADESHSGGSGFAAAALKLLILILVIFGLSLWLVPMAAPHLPTSIARHIMPGKQVTEARFAAIEEQVEANSQVAVGDVQALRDEIAALQSRLETAENAATAAQEEAAAARAAAEASAGAASSSTVAESVVTDAQTAAKEAAEAAETATAAATEAGKVASAATRDTASLARQMTSFEARLSGLKSEIESIGENLAAAAQDEGASSGEITAAFAALKAKVDALAEREPDLTAYIRRDESDGFATQDDLRSARTALGAEMDAALAALPEGGTVATPADIAELRGSVDGQVSALTGQIAGVEAKADDAVATAQAAQAAAATAEASATEAVSTVAGAIQGASVKSASAALLSRMASGLPYSAALDEIAHLTGAKAPDALAAAAASGLPTADQLVSRFAPLAPKAIAADLKAKSGDGALGQASARLESIFTGRPKNAEEGDSTGAILSRVEANLSKVDLAAALAEADTLSDAAKSGLGSWLGDLRSRVEAEAAAGTFIAEIGGSQG